MRSVLREHTSHTACFGLGEPPRILQETLLCGGIDGYLEENATLCMAGQVHSARILGYQVDSRSPGSPIAFFISIRPPYDNHPNLAPGLGAYVRCSSTFGPSSHNFNNSASFPDIYSFSLWWWTHIRHYLFFSHLGFGGISFRSHSSSRHSHLCTYYAYRPLEFYSLASVTRTTDST